MCSKASQSPTLCFGSCSWYTHLLFCFVILPQCLYVSFLFLWCRMKRKGRKREKEREITLILNANMHKCEFFRHLFWCWYVDVYLGFLKRISYICALSISFHTHHLSRIKTLDFKVWDASKEKWIIILYSSMIYGELWNTVIK